MPISITETAGGTSYVWPFVGEMNHPVHIKLDVSGMTSAEIDEDGILKPGVPLTSGGVLVTSGAVYGVNIEAVKVAAGNAAGDLSGAVDCLIAVGCVGVVNRDAVEANLGRVLAAAEIAGFAAAGSTLKLTTT